MLVTTIALVDMETQETAPISREKRRLRCVLPDYFSPAAMQKIVASKLNPAPGGDKQFGCVPFSDICSYTTLGEHLSPGEDDCVYERPLWM